MTTEETTSPRHSRRTARPKRRSLTLPLVFVAVITLKLYLTRVIVLGDANPLKALLLEGGFVLLLISVTALLPRGRVWAWLAIDVVASLVCIAIIVFVSQYDQMPTLGSLGLSREMGGVRVAVMDLLKPVYLLFLADIPVFVAMILASRPKGPTSRAKRAPAQAGSPAPVSRTRASRSSVPDNRLVIAAGVAAVWVLVTLVAVGVAGPADDTLAGARGRGLIAYALYNPKTSEAMQSDAQIEQELASLSATSTPKSSATGVPKSGQVSAASTQKPQPLNWHVPATVQRAFDKLQGVSDEGRVPGAPEPGVAKGKNVIVIQVESLSTWTTLAKVLGHSVTPNFNRLTSESWYVPRMITQIGPGNTSDAEFTVNTSLLADRSKPSSYIWGDKKLPSLPRLVRAKGYEALTFHTNHISYWRRYELYPALGFSKWYSKPDFPSTDIVDGIGASDRVLYQTVDKVLEQKRAAKKPFFAEVIGLAAHTPYFGASDRSHLQVPSSIHGTSLEDYLRAISYEDEQLGVFINRLKQNGMWNDSVVVIYGDHFGVRPVGGSSIPVTKRESDAIKTFLGRSPGWGDTYEVPLLIHLPGQKEAKRIDGVRGQVDVMPTIAEVMGISLASTPHTGRSVFDAQPRTIVMRYYVPNGTFITDTYLFRSGVGYDDAKVSELDAAASGNLPLSTVPKATYQRIKTLLAVNRRYLQSLPKR